MTTFLNRSRAVRRRRRDLDRHQRRHLVAEPPLPGKPTPGKQLAARQPMTPCRRQNLSAAPIALGNNPSLLFQRPPTSSTGRYHLDPRHLRYSRMISHTTMSQPRATSWQGGPGRRLTLFTHNLADVMRPYDDRPDAYRPWTAPMRPIAREIEFGSGIAADQLAHLPPAPCGRAPIGGAAR